MTKGAGRMFTESRGIFVIYPAVNNNTREAINPDADFSAILMASVGLCTVPDLTIERGINY